MELIVEIGQNHNGDMNLALDMVRIAAEAGADVAKFQVYDARALFPREGNPWFEYNCATELSRDDVALLADACRRYGIEFMASVFDEERVEWLEDLGVRRYKVASRSVTETPLLRRLAATGKPLLVSLGMWRGDGFPQIAGADRVEYLYCVSEYPTPLEHLHLQHCDFNAYAGFSDHSIGLTAAMAALSRGARIIEKHFTIDKTMYGPDHEGSMDAEELRRLVRFRDELALCLK
ncbi:N-acetylneuraminate synthase family protein [Oleidesulfovibrio alaskensis]|jgi:N-acetylneuraminate synthase/N,N'-diacetyllegionaminate synthase|uniref:N-acetylneuraminate synthase family protein n=1 Tax=Oleidesulfovibrio alaskensis TaxID=58180 RepID=UPI0004128620|nr:N-acetylneuraminate synthase family protein [Oleidesulfovibrio alaskensis]